MARRGRPSRAFGSKFEAALQDLSTAFFRTTAFHHAATRGAERELPLHEFFRAHLPGTYKVGRGEAVDTLDNHSPQLDVMIYDALRNYAFMDKDNLLLPAEALLVSVEVKSELTRDEMKKSLRAAEKLRSLRPFNEAQPADVQRDGRPRDYPCRYFHCVFAYGSDLIADDWLEREHRRLYEVAIETGISASVLDRVYVAKRGLINPSSGVGLPETGESGAGLLHFYMHILNFLARENAARDGVPYLEYAGRLTKGWRKLAANDR